MLDAAKKTGIDQLWATPHMRWSTFDRAKVQERFAELKEHAQDRGIELRLGFELYHDTLRKHGLHTAAGFAYEGTNRVLIEFNTGGAMASDWQRTVYRLQSEFGLEVVWAHPERYTTVWEDFDTVYRMKDAGCLVQVSARDLTGGLFDKRAKAAKRIMKEGLCDALVSDAHDPEGFETFRKMVEKWQQ